MHRNICPWYSKPDHVHLTLTYICKSRNKGHIQQHTYCICSDDCWTLAVFYNRDDKMFHQITCFLYDIRQSIKRKKLAICILWDTSRELQKKYQDRCEPHEAQRIKCSIYAGAKLTVANLEIISYHALVSDLTQLLSGWWTPRKVNRNCNNPNTQNCEINRQQYRTSTVMKCKNLQNNETKKKRTTKHWNTSTSTIEKIVSLFWLGFFPFLCDTPTLSLTRPLFRSLTSVYGALYTVVTWPLTNAAMSARTK